MHRSNKAFTLIELLVVIAIIAILAAILFPVFAQAKLAAKKASDLSNFKQTSLAILIYTNDFDDVYPMSTYWSDKQAYSTSYTWSSALCVLPYIKSTAIFHCPVDPNQTEYNAAYYGIAANRTPAYQSFQANAITPAYTMFQSAQFPNGVTNPQGLMPSTSTMPPCYDYICSSNTTTTTTEAPQPATIIMLAGGNHEVYDEIYYCGPWNSNELDWCYTGYGVSEQWKITDLVFAAPSDPYYLGFRKFANQSNFAFGDGHAKSLPPGNVTDPARWVINPPAGDTFSG